jgi:hypothetical protein
LDDATTRSIRRILTRTGGFLAIGAGAFAIVEFEKWLRFREPARRAS